MPDFSQFVTLQELYLRDNNVSVVQPEHLPPNLACLDLSWNKLAEVSDFSQCSNLQKLDLWHNNLSVVQLEHLPPNLTHLDISGNKLAEVPDFSQCVNHQKLDLHDNNLSVVQPELLPPNLTCLDLSENDLVVLQDFSHHKILKDLNISHNNSLHTIHGLPESLAQFSCQSLPVEIIKKCAFHKNTYKLLRKDISGKSLRQPPYGVYIQGLDAVLDYFTEKSVETTQNR